MKCYKLSVEDHYFEAVFSRIDISFGPRRVKNLFLIIITTVLSVSQFCLWYLEVSSYNLLSFEGDHPVSLDKIIFAKSFLKYKLNELLGSGWSCGMMIYFLLNIQNSYFQIELYII